MKFLVSLFICLFLGIYSIWAQSDFYIIGGLNMSNVKNYDPNPGIGVESGGDLKLGWHLGMGMSFDLTKKLSFNPEMQFSSKGFRSDVEPDGKQTISLIYLNTPLLIHLHLNDKFKVMLGPELGLKLASRVRLDGFGSSANEFYDNLFDLGFSLGAAYSISEKISVNLRFTHGFATIIKGLYYTDTGAGSNQIKFFNQNLQLSLTYDLFNKK